MDWRKLLTNKYMIYSVAFVVVVILGCVYKFLFIREYSGFASTNTDVSSSSVFEYIDESTSFDIQETIIDTVSTDTSVMETSIYVYVCGAVINPGVYEIDRGTLLVNAIDMAGGLTQDAATNHINLVMSLNENLSIYIPTQEEVINGLYNSEVIMSDSSGAGNGVGNTNSSEQRNGLININTASRADLMTVPGIGDVTADSIIEYRETNGAFGSIEDLMNVPGIGEGKFEKFREYVCV